jgi:erythromycin esterase
MKAVLPFLLAALVLGLSGCKEEEGPAIDPVTLSLVNTLNEELTPLSQDPVQWKDSDLTFLDALGDHAIVGLGEATHGTSEFFAAKHRMFRYLVENHDFKIFAIEADFGESILINQAVLTGNKSSITQVMKDNMHFWTWRTNEVRDLLYWMCDYNVGKAESDKLQYWGVDCQFNTFHPDMARDLIQTAQVPFMPLAIELLAEAETASGNQFAGYTQTKFDSYVLKIAALTDSLVRHKAHILSRISEKQYRLALHMLLVIKQVSDVSYYTGKQPSKNYRDEYMADNTAWVHNYFDGAKVALWAHNFHVANDLSNGTIGYHLTNDFPNDYASIGFLFSKGSFTAVTMEGDKFKSLERQSLDADPKEGSINDVMSRAESPVFTVSLPDLEKHEEWLSAFGRSIEYFHMGSGYNGRPEDYYSVFKQLYFDKLIYFNTTTSAGQIQ